MRRIGIVPKSMLERKTDFTRAMTPDALGVKLNLPFMGERSIVGITSIKDTNGDRTIYVASTTPPNSESTEPITTTVHWYLEGSPLGWELLQPIDQTVYALAGGSQVSNAELYIGASDGLYTWNRLANWQKVEETTEITLLATAPFRLIRRGPNRYSPPYQTNDWMETVCY